MDIYLPTLTVAGVLGFLAPLVSTAIGKLTWSGTVKQIFAIIVSAVLAIVALLLTDGFSQIGGADNPVKYWLTLSLVVIAVSQLAYRLVWKPTGVEAKLAAATATTAEKNTFLNEHTVTGQTIVDSTEARTAAAVAETDGSPVPEGYTPKH